MKIHVVIRDLGTEVKVLGIFSSDGLALSSIRTTYSSLGFVECEAWKGNSFVSGLEGHKRWRCRLPGGDFLWVVECTVQETVTHL